jgi:hypothetical protein
MVFSHVIYNCLENGMPIHVFFKKKQSGIPSLNIKLIPEKDLRDRNCL